MSSFDLRKTVLPLTKRDSRIVFLLQYFKTCANFFFQNYKLFVSLLIQKLFATVWPRPMCPALVSRMLCPLARTIVGKLLLETPSVLMHIPFHFQWKYLCIKANNQLLILKSLIETFHFRFLIYLYIRFYCLREYKFWIFYIFGL